MVLKLLPALLSTDFPDDPICSIFTLAILAAGASCGCCSGAGSGRAGTDAVVLARPAEANVVSGGGVFACRSFYHELGTATRDMWLPNTAASSTHFTRVQLEALFPEVLRDISRFGQAGETEA